MSSVIPILSFLGEFSSHQGKNSLVRRNNGKICADGRDNHKHSHWHIISRHSREDSLCRALFARVPNATDLIEHSVDLKPGAYPVREKVPRYTAAERAFANEIFSLMEDGGVTVRRSSERGAKTKFPSNKKRSPLLRVVHNYLHLNKNNIKSKHPVYRLEETINVVIKLGF